MSGRVAAGAAHGYGVARSAGAAWNRGRRMATPEPTNWTAAAALVGGALPPARWAARVRTWLEREADAGPWGVALSGGADSVALLLALVGARRAGALGGGPPELFALHFNHRLRGAEAEADAAFCRELCATLAVPLHVGMAPWTEGSDISEAEARDARLAFFDETVRAAGARVLWLGHQRDDVVETLLLRLARGSGSRGLAAPRPVQRLADGRVRLRPLLDWPKRELEAMLRTAGAAWREDASNHGDAYFRNRLRRHVVPAWDAATPNELGAAAARSRALLEEEDDALEAWVDRVLPTPAAPELALEPLRATPVAITRRALHRWLGGQGLGSVLTSAAFDELLAAVRAARSARFSAGAERFLVVTEDGLRCIAPESAPEGWTERMLPVPGEVALPHGALLRAARIALEGDGDRRLRIAASDDRRTVLVAMETIAPFSIRPWRAGDQYRPLGGTGTTKLQDQFVNRRIPREMRRRLPVVCGPEGEILWVPGLPPAENARITSGTAQAVQLTYLSANSLSDPSGHA